MALLFMESFDGYGGNNAHMTQYYAQPFLQTSSPTARTGTYYMKGSNDCARNITPATATLIIGVAYYWTTIASGTIEVFINPNGSNFQFTVAMGSDGFLRIYQSATYVGPLLETSASAVLVANSWNYLEIKVTVGNSGSWTVKCNGATVLNGSGDTQAQSTAGIGSIRFAPGNGGSMDDIVVMDSSGSNLNDFIGDCRVECIIPQAGNGSNTGLTPSTGTDHGAMVDDFPANDDTDYNSGTTAGVKDTYNFTNVTTTGTVKGVQVSARAKKTDSATKQLAIVARVGGADYDGTTQNLASTSYGQYVQQWAKRPSDSADWTVADINGAEFGLKVVS